MYQNQKCFFALLFLLCLGISSVYSFEGRPWFDEQGRKTDLINYNPDPNGEPWLGGGLKPLSKEEERKLKDIPEVRLTTKTRNRSLPAELILLNNDEFIPVFNQMGGSCAQASGVAYVYSYQLNVLRGVSGTDNNARAYGYTHNYLNGGNNSSGSWYWDGWEILTKHGAPDVTTFHNSPNGGLSGTRWMNGADRWHAANDNRVAKYEKITINSVDDIEKIKSWMYDLNGTDPHKKGGCVVFAANGSSASGNSTVASGTHAGEKLCTGLTAQSMNHAMTFAGYSDSVAGGALLLLNSWGKGWGTNGYVWVPYSTVVNGGLYKNEVWCITVEEHTPRYELRATVSNSSRSNITINTGFTNGPATSPDSVKSYGRAFAKSGGSHNMEGSGGAEAIEVSLDISDYFESMIGGEVTFFLQVKNESGYGATNCTVTNLTLLDYTTGSVQEFPASETSVVVAPGEEKNIPVSYTSSVVRYKVTSTAHGNGSISPKGVTVVDSATSKEFTMTADKWHLIDSVVVDGSNVGTDETYTFSDVDANHTIDVYFGWDDATPAICTLSCTKGTNGSISPSGVSLYTEGSDTVVEIKPNMYHTVDSVLVDGVNRGPLYSATFNYLSSSHTIESFYSDKGFSGKYALWNETTTYGENNRKDTVSHKSHLWESQWWNKNAEPGTGGEWKDLGEDVSMDKDTIEVAHLEYISNAANDDTLIITTYFLFGTDTTKTTIDTISNKVSLSSKQSNLKLQAYFVGNGKALYAPQEGVYQVTLFDLRGRELKHFSVNALKAGVVQLPVYRTDVSSGLYLMKVRGNKTELMKKIRL